MNTRAPNDDSALTALAEALSFDNQFTRELPADPNPDNQRRQVEGALYSRVLPATFAAPQTVAVSEALGVSLGLAPALLRSQAFADVFTGNCQLPGMDPHATVYAGHQFGNWAGQLGDGRAINLGEVRAGDGTLQMLQLKGAGPTPYSRTADGLAVLRSSVREFLCSEAMYHLGIPTTRALSLTLTGDQVLRDMLYDGNAAYEPGAVVCRVAPTFLRFGHYQLPASRGDHELLRTLVDFTIRTQFSELLDGRDRTDAAGALAAPVYLAWFAAVAERTLDMVLGWERVGFVHGVMNTDNLSITGLTIDYGPYGWLDDYDPDWTPNTTDAGQRRYRFGQQAAICQWNLLQLANALLPLIETPQPLQDVLSDFADRYHARRWLMLGAKLGLDAVAADDEALITQLHALLTASEVDMTRFYQALAGVDPTQTAVHAQEQIATAFYPSSPREPDIEAWWRWLGTYQARIAQVPAEERRSRMARSNPCYVLRNYLAQQAIDRAEQGDFSEIERLQALLARPYEPQAGQEAYAALRPDWARTRVGCSQLSCSS
ncbi:MAG: YdiU family protein [Pseudomonadota bacterium]